MAVLDEGERDEFYRLLKKVGLAAAAAAKSSDLSKKGRKKHNAADTEK